MPDSRETIITETAAYYDYRIPISKQMEPTFKSRIFAYSCIRFVGANNKSGRLKKKKSFFYLTKTIFIPIRKLYSYSSLSIQAISDLESFVPGCFSNCSRKPRKAGCCF